MTDGISKKIDDFFSKYRSRTYTKGQVLILNGDEAPYIYYLVSGKVKVYDVTYRGDEIILNVFKPPAFFPMSLAINNGVNPFIYEAESDIEVIQAPAPEVVEFVKSNPDVLFDLLSRVYRGTDALLGRVAHLMASSARSRLIYELLLEARRFGVSKNGGSTLSINEKDLGARAGLSRETVSREIHKLKADGMIETQSKEIRIKDLHTLEIILGKEV
jgi:CRP-like cAMP-binding protein